jgi:signal peptidase I
MAAMLALVALRLWFVDGLVRRVTIDGPSMAPAFCGAHYELTCSDCRFPIQIDAEHPPRSHLAACPNCGFTDNDLSQAQLRSPQRVLIDRWPLLWRQPRRGEVVAARDPISQTAFVIKRVAALPQEQLATQNGDLHLGGTPHRKTFAELDAIRILVHDNDYQPQSSAGLPPRWRAAKPDSAWRSDGTGFQIAQNEKNEDFDWLEYQHWPCTADSRLRGASSPIRDYDGYNQGPGPRELNAVSDVMLSCQGYIAGDGELAFTATNGNERMTVTIESASRIATQVGNRQPTVQLLKMPAFRDIVAVEFGLCDEQLLLAINRQTLVRVPCEQRPDISAESLHPLAVGVRGASVRIRHLKVWRDIYYLDPQGLPRPWRSADRIGPREVALLGDNQPVSTDSRHWESPGISYNFVLGRVYHAFWTRN